MRACCLIPALLLNACVVMTPSPALKALELATLTVSNASVLLPGGPDSPVIHAYERFDGACIELNRAVALADFVPALQAELEKNGVRSRVYETVLPETCRHSIHYMAQLEWGKALFSSEYQPYMSAARVELRQQGRVLAAASYRLGMMGLDKWASTREKLAPSVKAIANGLSEPHQTSSSRPSAPSAGSVQTAFSNQQKEKP
ncbi:cell division protein FtsI [Uliginosibacterium aquaticum]|uniref:Cell division protein FtsI n=1 Tax=Uliginosibacterium aquaticum TaxID=2731212 RepID=A0ABX2IIG1_9RHOO|nr:cell division protein FtsI [Uliginosibacterium aquaticum]NSL56613.1 cell division protein FtsI [Uliginosibacterium aquaticum]